MNDKEIIKQTNDLARAFYALMGYRVSVDFDFGSATHPQEVLVWNMACIAQERLKFTDVFNLIEELDDE